MSDLEKKLSSPWSLRLTNGIINWQPIVSEQVTIVEQLIKQARIDERARIEQLATPNHSTSIIKSEEIEANG